MCLYTIIIIIQVKYVTLIDKICLAKPNHHSNGLPKFKNKIIKFMLKTKLFQKFIIFYTGCSKIPLTNF